MQAATYTGIGFVVIEALWRLHTCNLVRTAELVETSSFLPSLYFFVTYLLTIATIFLNVKSYINDIPVFKSFISFLHACDSFCILIIGYAIYSRNSLILAIGMLIISKFFLLHVIARMVTGESANSLGYASLQATRAYVHHVGSFLFLPPQPVIICVTMIWRFVSMSGHSLLAYRDYFDKDTFYHIMNIASMSRNIAVLSVMMLTIIYPNIQRGFGLSATGHIAYLVVRVGPVFRLGSIYVKEGQEKISWLKLSDQERLRHVISGTYPMLTLEVVLLLSAIVYLLYLRMITFAIVTDNCEFI